MYLLCSGMVNKLLSLSFVFSVFWLDHVKSFRALEFPSFGNFIVVYSDFKNDKNYCHYSNLLDITTSIHHNNTLILVVNVKNKYVFSYLRTLTTWHCPHSSATRRCWWASAMISPARPAHSSKPATASIVANAGTDGPTETVPLQYALLRILCGQCQ